MPPRLALRPMALLLVAVAVLSRPPARAADFFDDSSELVLQSYRVVAERPQGDGVSEVDVAADLTNVGSGVWLSAGATIVSLPPDMEALQIVLRFDTVPLTGSIASSNAWTLSVPAEEVASLPQDFVEGRIQVKVLGTEVPIYSGPTHILDAATDLVYTGSQKVGENDMLTFSDVTPLIDAMSAGDVFLEDPLPGGYKSERGLSSLLPRKIVRKTVSETSFVQLECAVLQEGDVESATYKMHIGYSDHAGETLNVDVFQIFTKNCKDESNLPDDDGVPNRECLFSGLPFRFNDVELAPGVKLSGQVRLSGGLTSVEVRWRGLVPTRVVADLEVEYTASLEVKAEAGSDFDKIEKTLWNVPLPIFTTTIGGFPVEVSLSVDFLVGAKCDLRAEAITSVSQSVKTRILVGFSGSAPVFEPYLETVPFKLTPPHVTDAAGLHLKAWAGVDATLLVNEVKGPYVKTVAYATTDVEPLADPWWKVEAGVDVTAGVHAGLRIPFIGPDIQLDDPITHTWSYPLATFTPNGASGGSGAATGEGRGRGAGAARSADESSRWATRLSKSYGVYGPALVHGLAHGDSLLVSGGGVGLVARLDAKGNVLWQESLGFATLLDAVETPSGTIVVGGVYIKDLVLAELDANGSKLWQRTYQLDAETTATSFTAATDEAGEVSLYVAGFITHLSITDRDPWISRFDAAGRLLWAQRYSSPGADTVSAIHAAPGGGIVLAGQSDADVGTDLSMNGLVFRVNKDGDLLWGTALATFWGGSFKAVNVSPEGRVWAAGNASRTVKETYPSIWVVRLDLEQGLGDNMLLAQDILWEEYLGADASPDLPQWERTAGGHTAYDTGFAIEPFESGVIVAGSSGLGGSKTAVAARIDSDLGIRWMTLFDSPGEDLLTSVAVTDDGFLLAGKSPTDLATEAVGPPAALVQKVPLEGHLDFPPGAGIITRYGQPEQKWPGSFPQFVADGQMQADVVYSVSTIALVPKSTAYNTVAGDLDVTRWAPGFGDEAPPLASPRFLRGDCNGDGVNNGIPDVLTLLGYQFLGAAQPPCLAACDVTGDGELAGVADAVYLLGYFFLGGPALPAPFPSCAESTLPTDAALGCTAPPASCAE